MPRQAKRKSRPARSSRPRKGGRDWRALLGLIPGYDSFATAGDGMWFDEQAADNACGFFECLKHVEGSNAGEKLRLEDWQLAVVGGLLGWKRKDGTRRYREAMLLVPRKNGKTFLGAGFVLYMLCCDAERGVQAYSAAADRDQAALIHRVASGMILQDTELSARLQVYETFKSISDRQGVGIYKAISAEAKTKHGYNSHFVLVDELHAQPDRELVDVLLTSTGSRKQPLVLHITTADYDRESICNEKYDYACKVRDGIVDDPSFMPIIYEAQLEDDWTDPDVWRKANPNLGVSVSEEYLRRECQRAKEVPSFENTFKRLHLNIRTEQDQRWLQMQYWDECGAEVDIGELIGAECYGGLDLASTNDIAAFVLYFPDTHALLARMFCPAESIMRRAKRDGVPYDAWVRDGYLTATEGNVIDYEAIRLAILDDSERFKIKMIGYDPWNAQTIVNRLVEHDGLPMVEFRQGFASMNEPTKRFEAMVVGGLLRHGMNPALRWMASNVSVMDDPAGNIKPSKKKSTEKIDGIVASIMAVGCSMASDKAEGPSVYESEGVFAL